MSAEQSKGGGLPAWLAAPVAGVVAVAVAPPLVKAAVMAAVLAVVLVVALAHGHGMTVRAAAVLYAGRAVLAVAKAVAVVAVEWPLRGAHRVWVRYDAALRARLAVTRTGVAARVAGAAALTRAPGPGWAVEAHRAEVLALPATPAQSAAPRAVEPVPSCRHDGTTAA